MVCPTINACKLTVVPTASHRTLPADCWPPRWTLLDSAPASAVHNMATDLALLRCAAAADRAVLRIYRWEQPTVSFGRHESVKGVWDVQAMLAAGLQVVRRPTGGRALLHAHDVTYSVTLPMRAAISWRTMYNSVNTRLIQALQSLGAPVHLSERGSSVLPRGALCFSAPSEGEIMLGGQKIAGSAVWRADGAYLQHGTILLRNTQRSLESFRIASGSDASSATHAPQKAAAGAELFVAEPDEGQVAVGWPLFYDRPWSSAPVVAEAMRDTWRAQARDIRAFEPSPEDVNALTIARRELATPDWLWRR